jgi:TRAP-type C4-dicarboxylate transport system permease small subunit
MPALTWLSRHLTTTSRLIGRLVAHLCVLIIYVMLGLLVTQVFMRYFLGAPPSWTEELAIILFAWLVLLYATQGVREQFHVMIETIPARWVTLRRISDRVVSVLIIGFGLVTLTAGINYVERTAGQRSAALQIPIEALYLCVPCCGALLILHATARLLDPVQHDIGPDLVTPA